MLQKLTDNQKKLYEKIIILGIILILSFFSFYQYYYIFKNKEIQENKIKKEEKRDVIKKEEKKEFIYKVYYIKKGWGEDYIFSKNRKKYNFNLNSLKKEFPSFDFDSFFKKYKEYDILFKNKDLLNISYYLTPSTYYQKINLNFFDNNKKKLWVTYETEVVILGEDLKDKDKLIKNINFNKGYEYKIVGGKGFEDGDFFILKEVIISNKNKKQYKKINILRKKYKKIKIEKEENLKKANKLYLENNIVKLKFLFKSKGLNYNKYINFHRNKNVLEKYYDKKIENLNGDYENIIKTH